MPSLAAAFVPTLFELRSYLARPGKRDVLVDMFEDLFLDAYQAGGTRIVGTFRALDDPDRWVWLRAFPDAPSRGARLRRFYGGAVWRRNAAACNATILDVADALLLRELQPGHLTTPSAAPRGCAPVSCVYALSVQPVSDAEASVPPAQLAESTGVGAIATFRSDQQVNSFPGQAVRPGAVVVTLRRFGLLEDARAWQGQIAAPVETLLLTPTARSGLR